MTQGGSKGKSDSPMLSRLMPAVRTRLRNEAEMERARQLQESLLPREVPQLRGFQIDCRWQPSEMVSGDYYDVFPLDGGAMALCIADVAGKGPEAVELAGRVRDAVRRYAPGAASSAELCTRVNRALSGTIAPAKYITLLYAVLEASGRVRYENAGHCQPLLMRANGAVEFPSSFSGVVGIFSHWLYQNQEIELHAGDWLLLLTDGILDAENRQHEAYGYRRLIAHLERQRGQRVESAAGEILAEVSRFCRGRFVDDASLIVVKMQ